MNPFITVLNSLLPEPQVSLLSGILFGVRASIPKYLYDSLVTTGTLHIIALSGVNITILTNLTARITLFLGRKTSSIFTLCLIVLFVLFVGPSPSILRAAIMGSMSLLSVYFGKLDWSLLSLFLASLIMLLFNFSLINNISFQLSFLATLGIISCLPAGRLVNSKIVRKGRNRLLDQLMYALKLNLKITLSAQIFTLPIILYNFRRISLIAPIANLLIEWAIQPIMVLGFIASILGWLWLPLGILPAWFVWVPLTYLIKVVELLAEVPGAAFNF